MIPRLAVVLALLLTVAGCTTTESGTSTPGKVDIGRFADADPCGFLDPATLRGFGEPQEPVGSFASCYAVVSASATKSLFARVSLTAGVRTSASQVEQVNGLTVHSDPADTDECARDIAVRPGVVIAVTTPSNSDPCALSDALTESITARVRGGTIPQTHYPPASLAHRDACAMLDRPRAPGAADEVHPGFGGHVCTWGAEDITKPSVVLWFGIQAPAAQRLRDGAVATQVRGHAGVLGFTPAQTSATRSVPSNCEVAVDYQPLTPPRPDLVESAAVMVIADVPREQLCANATDLLTKVIDRLAH